MLGFIKHVDQEIKGTHSGESQERFLMKAEVAITTPGPILKQATNPSDVGSPLAGWNSKEPTFKPVSN
jgi:hypothetical protein